MKTINGFPNCPDDPDWDNARLIFWTLLLSGVAIFSIVLYNC